MTLLHWILSASGLILVVLALRALLVENGWTWVTALCTIVFSVMHWPCSTTCLTIRKESQSWKWTALAVLIPTVCGLGLCFLIHTVSLLAQA